MDAVNYPLEELVKIKQKRFEQAVKLVEEKKNNPEKRTGYFRKS